MSDLSSFQITSRSQWACSMRQWPRMWASRSAGVVSSAVRLVMYRTASQRVRHWPLPLKEGGVALDEDGLGGALEAGAGGGGQDADGAGLDVAVTDLAGSGADRGGLPGEGVQGQRASSPPVSEGTLASGQERFAFREPGDVVADGSSLCRIEVPELLFEPSRLSGLLWRY